jgi:cytidylate kinase
VTDCFVIAVDGPAGSGKSSAARGVARALGLRYLDTGAMYRALTWWMIQQGVDVASPAAVAARARRPAIEVGTDVTRMIRTREVSNAVSGVARVPEVRAHLVAMQREIITASCQAGDGIVAEGRDIGTVVAPDAGIKVFLTASEAERARRRAADLTADPAATVEVTQSEQQRRDRTDAPQTVMAADAVQIDSTALGLDEVVGVIVGLARQRADVAWTG